ncbi:extracellular solute-binding protein [Chloroflexota bacterium]
MSKHVRLSLLIIGVLLVSMIAQCGTSPSPEPAPPEAEQPAAEVSDEVVTLTMWGNHPEWKDPVLAMVEAFEAEHPNIKVEVEQKPADTYPVALNTALAGGEVPDLIGFYPGPALAEAANSGQILDATGKVDSERLTQSAQAASMVGDKVYGVPGMGAYTVGLFYQKGIFEEAGVEPPTTWEELMSVSEELRAAGVAPMIMPAKDAIIPFFFYIMAVDSVLGPEGYDKLTKGEVKLTDEELVQATQLTRDMVENFQEGYLSTSYVEGKALFAREQGAMMIGGSADYAGYREVNPDVDVGVVAFPPPAGSGMPVTTSGMELVYAVSSGTEHPDEAMTFLNWLTSDEAGQMVADNITLSTVQGIVPSDNPVLAEMVRASENDVRVWYEIPATGGVLDVFGTHVQELFTDALTPEEFSQLAQDSITPAE